MQFGIPSDEKVDRARELIVALDAAEFPVKAAFWSPVGELGKWRLFIASGLVDEEGPLHAYGILQSVAYGLKPSNGGSAAALDLTDISMIGLKSNLFREMKSRTPWAVRRTAKKLKPDFDVFRGDTLIYKLR